jgi:hypothetical protein
MGFYDLVEPLPTRAYLLKGKIISEVMQELRKLKGEDLVTLKDRQLRYILTEFRDEIIPK